MASSEDDGFITPPPGLIPPELLRSHRPVETDSATHRIAADAPRGDGAPPFFAAPIGSPPPTVEPPTLAPPVVGGPAAAPDARALIVGGERHVIDRSTLLGRNPATSSAWPDADLLPIDDPAKTVSKTHAVIERSGERFSVQDLDSTNGVRVIRNGAAPILLTPNTPAELGAGDQILLGDFRVDFV